MNQEALAQLEREKEQLMQLISLLMIQRQHPLPLRIEPKWTPEMGRRMSRARRYQCKRVDRRRSHWRHIERGMPGVFCQCMSQHALAQQLGVSQPTIARIERGGFTDRRIELAALWSVFGEATIYILTGWDRVKYEGFPQRRKRSA